MMMDRRTALPVAMVLAFVSACQQEYRIDPNDYRSDGSDHHSTESDTVDLSAIADIDPFHLVFVDYRHDQWVLAINQLTNLSGAVEVESSVYGYVQFVTPWLGTKDEISFDQPLVLVTDEASPHWLGLPSLPEDSNLRRVLRMSFPDAHPTTLFTATDLASLFGFNPEQVHFGPAVAYGDIWQAFVYYNQVVHLIRSENGSVELFPLTALPSGAKIQYLGPGTTDQHLILSVVESGQFKLYDFDQQNYALTPYDGLDQDQQVLLASGLWTRSGKPTGRMGFVESNAAWGTEVSTDDQPIIAVSDSFATGGLFANEEVIFLSQLTLDDSRQLATDRSDFLLYYATAIRDDGLYVYDQVRISQYFRLAWEPILATQVLYIPG